MSQGDAFSDEAGIRKAPRTALAIGPLRGLTSDAVPLERTPNGEIAAAARRVGNGRVLQVGYGDTWRWRMAGTDEDPVSAYREWWATMVSSVAYASRTPHAAPDALEPTPLATLISVLGPATPMSSTRVSLLWLDPRWLAWLFVVAPAALLLEWTSRRLRGIP